jgi:Na+/H+-translocating membrane pyrophosphatase
MALTSVSVAKSILGIPAGVTFHDALLTMLVGSVDSEVLGILGQSGITQTTYSEIYDIEDVTTNDLGLRHFPVASIAAITDGGQLRTATDYYVDQNTGTVRLVDDGDAFTQGRQTVAVTYTAGWSTVPADVQLAAAIIVAARFNALRHAGLASENANGYSYQVADAADAAIPSQARQILGRYRRVMFTE